MAYQNLWEIIGQDQRSRHEDKIIGGNNRGIDKG